ncbi:efflux transporter outer membrane subunit [Sulfurospirillum barnesii]|uniref:Efflux transporter, outer membrane factor lipoprotein, NodT family n=1 Tax=Sulfurospirillum barnesii (strain ATCC 700032 / DSM 10660 / SES-3) TaxID=760154 RepID=I3XZ93_SULBS|nr:efflux transporter outer membrane subunit [Sulfurospirillum barnesii]AFL69267.1 efflux transporter, outer membrane factor lipoprotein, NodT family [Sulfurospirillum barnesii SES-3]
MQKYSLVLIPFLFVGCMSMAPEYVRPTAPIPSTFDVNTSVQKSNPQDLSWEAFIQEPSLQAVVAQALEQSRDLKKAVANIEMARATYRVTRSAQFPSIDASATGSKARSISGESTAISESSTATVGLSSYELDFFGKVKSQSEASLESYKGVEEAEKTVRIALIAETINAWLSYASDTTLLHLAKQTEQSAKRSLEVVQKRVDLGVDTKVSLYNAQSIYQQARVDVANYTTQVAHDRSALELLVGAKVADVHLPKGLEEEAQAWLLDVPVGLSSEILLNRPDVLSAEHNLKSANANIGVARAAYFPSITLTTKGGVGTNSLTGLFDGGTSKIWSFAPTVTLPIFDMGERDANLDYAKAKKALYLATYEATIQTAFSEVERALSRRATIFEQYDAQKALVEANANSYAIYDARYQKGVDTYLNALLSQRSFYSSQKAFINVRLEELINRVTLYRVLGGGITQNQP